MQFLDLYAAGKELWAELDSVDTGFYPAVRNDADSVDDLVSTFLHTEFRTGTMHYVRHELRSPVLGASTCPVIMHPEHGIWFVHIGEDSDPFPELPASMADEGDVFYDTWNAIYDEFGWDDVPFGCLLLFPNLERNDCIADFEPCPMPVFFKDDLVNLPNLLRNREKRTRTELLSVLGAMNMVGHVLPMVFEGCDVQCGPELARKIWGTTTPERGLPMMN
jgi:hypothetical protein